MYEVFKVEGGWQVFWCPSAPTHYSDKVPYDGHIYPQRQGAYRRKATLMQQKRQGTKQKSQEEPAREVA
jgi:hypothetical protein